jgi:hypothetical protein
MGIVGLDGQVLWVYANPGAEAPVFKVALPETVTLLYDFLELVPEGSGPAPKPLRTRLALVSFVTRLYGLKSMTTDSLVLSAQNIPPG